jgi:hypothetical protein
MKDVEVLKTVLESKRDDWRNGLDEKPDLLSKRNSPYTDIFFYRPDEGISLKFGETLKTTDDFPGDSWERETLAKSFLGDPYIYLKRAVICYSDSPVVHLDYFVVDGDRFYLPCPHKDREERGLKSSIVRMLSPNKSHKDGEDRLVSPQHKKIIKLINILEEDPGFDSQWQNYWEMAGRLAGLKESEAVEWPPRS